MPVWQWSSLRFCNSNIQYLFNDTVIEFKSGRQEYTHALEYTSCFTDKMFCWILKCIYGYIYISLCDSSSKTFYIINEVNVKWFLKDRHVHLTIISFTRYGWPKCLTNRLNTVNLHWPITHENDVRVGWNQRDGNVYVTIIQSTKNSWPA